MFEGFKHVQVKDEVNAIIEFIKTDDFYDHYKSLVDVGVEGTKDYLCLTVLSKIKGNKDMQLLVAGASYDILFSMIDQKT